MTASCAPWTVWHDDEKAVIPEDRLPLLSRYEARAAHHEVVSANEPP